MLAFLTGCGRHYAYGVHKNDPQLKQMKDIYGYRHDKNYRFESTLLESPSVVIFHLQPTFEDKEVFESVIYFECDAAAVKSFKLEHRTSDGTLVEPIKSVPLKNITSSPLAQKMRSKTELYYQKEDLPKEVYETIKVILRDGEILEYKIPLKHKLHYTQWDVIMGV